MIVCARGAQLLQKGFKISSRFVRQYSMAPKQARVYVIVPPLRSSLRLKEKSIPGVDSGLLVQEHSLPSEDLKSKSPLRAQGWADKQNEVSKHDAESKGQEKKLAKPVRSKQPDDSVTDVEDFGKKLQAHFQQEESLTMRDCLLRWYDKNHRELPWRTNPHSQLGSDPSSSRAPESSHSPLKKRRKGGHQPPAGPVILPDAILKDDLPDLAKAEGVGDRAYAVWVSEIMCQQTRIVVVVEYFNRWMQKWPTVAQLAQATQEEVNQVWAGLGYYRRARFLLEGARYITAELKGRFPCTVPELLKVPGIGAYTAGAIASIAFGVRTPVVDGNVVRVLSRLRTIGGDPTEKNNVKLHWALAEQLVDPFRPGCFNQALMELGALVCTPTSPDCPGCPISGQCRALERAEAGEIGSVTEFPGKKVKKAPREETVAVCVVELRKGTGLSGSSVEYLLIQRPATGLLAGLWEFPTVAFDANAGKGTRQRALDSLLARFTSGFEILERSEVGEYVHVFSHIRQTMRVEKLVIERLGKPDKRDGSLKRRKGEGADENGNGVPCARWVPADEMTSVGLTSGVRKVLEMARSCGAFGK